MEKEAKEKQTTAEGVNEELARVTLALQAEQSATGGMDIHLQSERDAHKETEEERTRLATLLAAAQAHIEPALTSSTVALTLEVATELGSRHAKTSELEERLLQLANERKALHDNLALLSPYMDL